MKAEKKWYQMSGTDSDVIISTRVRLARNLRGYPFPCVMTDEQRGKVNGMVKDAVINGGSALSGRFSCIELEKLKPYELASLVERHLISPDFASQPKGKMLLLLDDESVSIMVCEEDHLRIQVIGQGMAPDEIYDTADKLDTLLSERLGFAYDEKLGYLTACPTNLGTAMRVSVMAHLPALEAGGALRSLSESISKLGLTIRGMYGEGTQSRGAIYQISNCETMGITEKDTIEKLKGVIAQITKLERDARTRILQNPAQQDAVWRAYGILRSARMLSGDEFVRMYSVVRMGATGGLLADISTDSLNELFITVQPATLMQQSGKQLTAQQRDQKRAEIVRAALA